MEEQNSETHYLAVSISRSRVIGRNEGKEQEIRLQKQQQTEAIQLVAPSSENSFDTAVSRPEFYNH
ncbi:hypothetical protein Csa_003174 [Cucumis sativus]|nr:hypothetical protein Csa_003174 [Cucumis sativus]